MTDMGQVVTCYSYKGGCGAELRLASIAVILSAVEPAGCCASTGISRHPVWTITSASTTSAAPACSRLRSKRLARCLGRSPPGARVRVSPRGGCSPRRAATLAVDLLSAGRPHTTHCGRRVQGWPWTGRRLYSDRDFGALLEGVARRAWMPALSSAVLIDRWGPASRISAPGICTRAQLPDVHSLILLRPADKALTESYSLESVTRPSGAHRSKLPI
mgnify:CR=1 FL=1